MEDTGELPTQYKLRSGNTNEGSQQRPKPISYDDDNDIRGVPPGTAYFGNYGSGAK
jgi:hypothetical protein